MENRRLWLAGLAAGLLTVAIVGGLLYVRFGRPAHTAEPGGTVTVSGVDFKCRLPVIGPQAAGFISFPDGAFSLDRSVKFDKLRGAYGQTYDAQVGRWVPVPAFELSPDGRSYSYIAMTSGVPGQMNTLALHTHEILNGKDRVLWEGSGFPQGGPGVTWLPSGIYFTAALPPEGAAPGPTFPAVYVVDPNKPGPPRRLGPNPPPAPPAPGQPYTQPDQFGVVGGGAAWGTRQRVPEKPPELGKPPEPGTYGPYVVVRMDLGDGSVSTWYTASGSELVTIMGLDAQGRPVLNLFQPVKPPPTPTAYTPPPVHLLVLTGPNQTAEITSGKPDFRFTGTIFADSHGVWFGSLSSIWLYSAQDGLRRVVTIPQGLFPTPSPPPGYAPPSAASGAVTKPVSPYGEGTFVMVAGACS